MPLLAFLPPPAGLPRAPVRSPRRHRAARCAAEKRLSGKTILVTGATGPTGRLICGALHARGASVRALIRPRTYMYDRARVHAVRELCPDVRYVMGDLRDSPSLAAAVAGCHGVVAAAGTRNFEGGDPNRPEVVDFLGMQRLMDAFMDVQLEQDLVLMLSGDEAERGGNDVRSEDGVRQVPTGMEICEASRFVLVSSLGVTRPERFPQLQQMASMLTYKLSGEDVVRNSGCPFTIVRPGGFVDTPRGEARLIFDQGDRIAGSVSRADVAEICAEAIFCPTATNITFECVAQPGFEGTGLPVSAETFVELQADSF